jgi:GntR family transcriptional regulator
VNIVVDNSSPIPLYKQIYDQISSQIVNGQLENGYCLPPIRTVAKQLRISVITIKRAWDELEKDGYITTVPGGGCYVKHLHGMQRENIRISLAQKKMAVDIKYYKSIGISLQQAQQMMNKLWDKDCNENQDKNM